MASRKPINRTPVQTWSKRTRADSGPDTGTSPITNTPKGWATGLPFFDVSRWSFWASKESDTHESKPEMEQPEKGVSEAGTLDPAEQEYPALEPRQSNIDEERVKNEFISAPIEAFGEVPNAFSRPPSPSTETSVYENTFEFNQGDNLDPDTRAAYLQAENGMTDEQYANYQ